MLYSVNIIRSRALEHQLLALDSLSNYVSSYTNEYLGCEQADGTSIETSQRGHDTALDKDVRLITYTSVRRGDPVESWGKTSFNEEAKRQT